MSHRRFDSILGACLALGAPVGLWLVRAVRAGSFSWEWTRNEVADDSWTYLYVTFSTVLAFYIFGRMVGRVADRLAESSITDILTGLRNRSHLENRLHEEFARAVRHGFPLSLLLLDVDELKALNDHHGHRAGDAALCHVARAIREGLRASDVAARWGGDEFVLLAPNTRADEAISLAERVRSLVATAPAQAGLAAVTISMGVATLTAELPFHTPEALLRTADTALYMAKRSGRNRVIAV
jgi:diguanylate cyclase (GGDEF)-like protein